MAAHHYNYAIVCRIPKSFKYTTNIRAHLDEDIDIETARQEHRDLIESLKKCDLRVIELQEDEDYPDCTFLEDCAVAIGGTALIARPSQTSRHGEVAEIRKVLNQEMKLKVFEIEDAAAIVNGGDVFFTGKEIFVGIGEGRTNECGAQAVAGVFPEYNVTPINLKGTRRLKSLVCMAGKDIIAVGNSALAQHVITEIRLKAQYNYRILKLDNDEATNMIYANGRLIHRTRGEIGEDCCSILDEKITYCKHRTGISEIAKAHGTLTSMVLFVDKHRIRKDVISNIVPADLTAYAEVKNL